MITHNPSPGVRLQFCPLSTGAAPKPWLTNLKHKGFQSSLKSLSALKCLKSWLLPKALQESGQKPSEDGTGAVFRLPGLSPGCAVDQLWGLSLTFHRSHFFTKMRTTPKSVYLIRLLQRLKKWENMLGHREQPVNVNCYKDRSQRALVFPDGKFRTFFSNHSYMKQYSWKCD